jgi:hypothetical protein
MQCFKRRFHGGFTSVARSAWKPLDQWEHSFQKTPRRGSDFARIGIISIFQSHAEALEACACVRTRNYIIESADVTAQR